MKKPEIGTELTIDELTLKVEKAKKGDNPCRGCFAEVNFDLCLELPPCGTPPKKCIIYVEVK